MKTGFKTIDNLPIKYLAAIDSFSDEKNNGDGYWIYLKPPFSNCEMESNIIHEQKISDLILILKTCVDNHPTNKKTLTF